MFHTSIDHPRLANATAMKALRSEARLSKAALAKAVSLIGTPPNESANDMALFVPESLQKFWTAETARNEHVVASRGLPVVEAHSTKHEWVVTEEYGGRYITHFFDENGTLPAVNRTKSRPGSVNLKLFGERRQIGRLGEIVGQIGNINPGGPPMVSRSGRQRETANALRAEVLAYEHAFLWGDSAVNALEFDGTIKQFRTNGINGLNVHDLRGDPLTFARLLRDISRVRSKPYYAKIEKIRLSERQWASLAVETTDSARWARSGTEMKLADGWTFNPVGMYLQSPNGDKTVFEIVPMLAPDIALPSEAEGTVPVSGAIAITGVVPSVHASSQFEGPTADFIVAVKTIYAGGSPVHVSSAATELEAGEIFTVTMTDANVDVYAYEVWLSDPDGDASTLKFYKRVPAHPVSLATATTFTVTFDFLPGTEVVTCEQISGHAQFLAQLLPPTRFPVPYAGFATDFIIARCDAPVVNHYHQQIIYLNCGENEVT